MTTEHLHTQINRYFDGDLSVAEEKYLLGLLLDHQGEDPLVDEALSVMSWTHLQPERMTETKPAHRNRKRSLKSFAGPMTGIAADMALIACVAVSVFHLRQSEPQCYAYIDGRYISDPDEVKDLIETQIGEMSLASRQTSDEAIAELEEIAMIISSQTTKIE